MEKVSAHGEEAIIEGHMATLRLQRWKISPLHLRFTCTSGGLSWWATSTPNTHCVWLPLPFLHTGMFPPFWACFASVVLPRRGEVSLFSGFLPPLFLPLPFGSLPLCSCLSPSLCVCMSLVMLRFTY